MDNIPWPERYRPRTVSLLVGNNDVRDQLRNWIESWKKSIPKKRAVLLVGPPGVGKTASAYAIAHDLDMELVEFNASDKRNKDTIERIVWRAATQETLDGRKRLILLDEVDGLSGTGDRGGAGAISRIISQSVHPIVMTANDPDNPRLKDFTKVCLTLTFQPISHEDIVKVLKRILKDASKHLDDEQLSRIADKANGDLRAAISDLETAIENEDDTFQDVSERNTRRPIEQTLRRLFMNRDPAIAKEILSEADSDHDEVLLWIEENLHLQLNAADELDRGYEAISLADQVLGRIMNQQSWKLLSYFYDFLSINLTNSRTKTPFRRVKYNRPAWPLLVWKGGRQIDKRAKLLSKLSDETVVSRFRASRTYGYVIDLLLERDSTFSAKMADWLQVKPEEVSFRSRRKGR